MGREFKAANGNLLSNHRGRRGLAPGVPGSRLSHLGAIMPVESVTSLVDSLRQCRLLTPAQLDELSRQLPASKSDPRTLAKELLQRGWLTPYQINQLFQRSDPELVLGQYVLLERL